MALGPVANAIYTNQQTPFVATVKADHIARFDLQNMMAAELLKDEEKKIQEIREAEENQSLNPDREEHKEGYTPKKRKNKKEKEEDVEIVDIPGHHIDIKV